jgi:pyridoxine 5-phosphate synthase
MPRLHVNIDHVATLRQARRGREPDPIEAAAICERAGATGITVHLREDRRHIQDEDVRRLRQSVRTLLNLEMAATEEMTAIACALRPDEVCIVPEHRQELTTEGGLDVAAARPALERTIPQLRQAGIAVSLFVAPDADAIALAARLGATIVELHTGAYAQGSGAAQAEELRRLVAAALQAHDLGLRVNAGHGLDCANVGPIARLPHVEELNIGYSIICRALFIGLDAAVREMHAAMRAAAPPA